MTQDSPLPNPAYAVREVSGVGWLLTSWSAQTPPGAFRKSSSSSLRWPMRPLLGVWAAGLIGGAGGGRGRRPALFPRGPGLVSTSPHVRRDPRPPEETARAPSGPQCEPNATHSGKGSASATTAALMGVQGLKGNTWRGNEGFLHPSTLSHRLPRGAGPSTTRPKRWQSALGLVKSSLAASPRRQPPSPRCSAYPLVMPTGGRAKCGLPNFVALSPISVLSSVYTPRPPFLSHMPFGGQVRPPHTSCAASPPHRAPLSSPF